MRASDRILDRKHAINRHFCKLAKKCIFVDPLGSTSGRSPGERGMNRLSTNGIATGIQLIFPDAMTGSIRSRIFRWCHSSCNISSPVQSAIFFFTKLPMRLGYRPYPQKTLTSSAWLGKCGWRAITNDISQFESVSATRPPVLSTLPENFPCGHGMSCLSSLP